MATWNKDQTKALIGIYKQYPCLYDATDTNYSNKTMKYNALRSICNKLKNIKPDITIAAIKQKAKNLKTQFHKEEAYRKQSENSDEGYQPKLWNYNELQFLKQYTDSSPGISNINKNIFQEELSFTDVNKSKNQEHRLPREKTNAFEKNVMDAFAKASQFLETLEERQRDETREDAFAKYLAIRLREIKLDQNFEDVTIEILELVRKTLIKEKAQTDIFEYLPAPNS